MASDAIQLGPNVTLLSEAGVNISAAATTALIAAIQGRIVRVYKLFLNAGAAQTVDIRDSANSLSGGLITFATGGGVVFDLDGTPWFTSANRIDLVTTTTGQLSGKFYYTQQTG